MQAYDLLSAAQDGHAIGNLARHLGVSESDASHAIEALLPAVTLAIEKNTADRRGLASLIGALASGNHARYADDARLLSDPATVADGKAITAHLFGSEAQAERAILKAAAASGIGAALLRQLLPYLVTMLMGVLFKGAKGGLGDILSRIPGAGGGDGWGGRGPASGGSSAGDNPFKDMGDILTGGRGRAPRGGGRPLDIPVPGGGPSGDSPFNLPGGAAPRTRVNPLPWPTGVEGGQPPSSPIGWPRQDGSGGGGGFGQQIGTATRVRDLIGSVLGFRGRGMMGWLVSFVVWRFGGRILRGLLSLLFRRRL